MTITNVWRVTIDTLTLYIVNTTLVFTYVVLNCVSREGLLTIIYNGAVLDRPCLSFTKAIITLGNYRFTYNGAVYWTSGWRRKYHIKILNTSSVTDVATKHRTYGCFVRTTVISTYWKYETRDLSPNNIQKNQMINNH